MADCVLGPGTGICSFNAKAGGKVTLTVEGTSGEVEFKTAKYNGVEIKDLTPDQLSFTVAAGKSELDIVFRFSDQQHGSGVLKEVCTNNPPLRDVAAMDPAVVYYICG
jgi:hypothetical protein